MTEDQQVRSRALELALMLKHPVTKEGAEQTRTATDTVTAAQAFYEFMNPKKE